MTTGCNNGLLTDPRAYFFRDVIRRVEGSSAPDWKAVLEELHFGQGMWKNPAPGAPVAADAPFYGITVMIDAGGNARGRIWLPTEDFTTDGKGNRWYTHEIQVIADGPDDSGIVWAWEDKGGAPYTPRACDGSSVQPTPPIHIPPSSGSGDELNYAFIGEAFAALVGPIVTLNTAALQAQVDALQQKVDELAGASQPEPTPLPKKIALKDSRGQYLCADRDRAEGVNVPILANRDGRGEWETFDLEPVE